MQIVIDTNVLVGACMGNGASREVVEACLRGQHIALVGAALLGEYEDVLARERLFDGCRLSQPERSELLDALLSVSRWTRVYYAWRPNLPDEGDNHLIELAVAGNASHVVTRNLRDLCRSELKFPLLSIVSPEQFLKENAS